MPFNKRSKTKIVLSTIALWARVLAHVGFLTILFTGTPRVFDDQSHIAGSDTAHADAPLDNGCGIPPIDPPNCYDCNGCGNGDGCTGGCDCSCDGCDSCDE